MYGNKKGLFFLLHYSIKNIMPTIIKSTHEPSRGESEKKKERKKRRFVDIKAADKEKAKRDFSLCCLVGSYYSFI